LEAKGLTPAPPADKRTLIRRATFDLTGLPPTPEEIDAFLKDDSPGAFAAAVERLLAAPAYGERWGRHWLDAVRYADTAGDNSDFPVPQMYRYRNWVIDAVNRDLPYDEFVRQQLAGDLLPAANGDDRSAKLVATGYLANARRFGSYEGERKDGPKELAAEEKGADEDEETKQARIAALDERIEGLKAKAKKVRDEKAAFEKKPLPYDTAYAVAEGTKKVGNARVQVKGAT